MPERTSVKNMPHQQENWFHQGREFENVPVARPCGCAPRWWGGWRCNPPPSHFTGRLSSRREHWAEKDLQNVLVDFSVCWLKRIMLAQKPSMRAHHFIKDCGVASAIPSEKASRSYYAFFFAACVSIFWKSASCPSNIFEKTGHRFHIGGSGVVRLDEIVWIRIFAYEHICTYMCLHKVVSKKWRNTAGITWLFSPIKVSTGMFRNKPLNNGAALMWT